MEPSPNKPNQTVQAIGKGASQNKLKPSQLLSKQISGNALEELNYKPKIVQFLNIADFSSYTDSAVSIDEPLFEPVPAIIQFTDYEPLQVKEKILSLRNKDKYARRIKVIPPDSRLFQVLPYNKTKKSVIEEDISKMSKGSKVNSPNIFEFYSKFSRLHLVWNTVTLSDLVQKPRLITLSTSLLSQKEKSSSLQSLLLEKEPCWTSQMFLISVIAL